MIKDQNGFSKEGSWYKGNLHSHTTNSDGKLSPEQAVQLFKENGYSFLCFSEHDLYTDYRKEFDSDGFIILPGLEASAVLAGEDGKRLKVHHIHGILGTRVMQEVAKERLFIHGEAVIPDIAKGSWNGAAKAQALADYLKSRGCITTYNHPIWSRVTAEEFIHTEGIWAMEIFNYNTVNESNTGFDTTYWDSMLRQGTHIAAIATDDNHNEGLFDDALGGYIVVKAPSLTHENIVQNLINHNYYSSAGPEIHDWGIRDGAVYVECSPVYRIDFITGNHLNDGTSVVCRSHGETIEQASFTLHGDESYVRIQCTDKYGRTAWSNPLWLSSP